MFKRYPYWGWLLLSILLWGITSYRFYTHDRALQPRQMARTISDDLHKKEKSLEAFLREKELIEDIFSDSLTNEEQEKLLHLPFYVFAYDNDTLSYWNTNTLQQICNPGTEKLTLLNNTKGAFLQQCISPSFTGARQKLVLLLPLVVKYPMENDYLKSHFLAADYIPSSTQLLEDSVAGSLAVRSNRGAAVFYLKFLKQDAQHGAPDNLLLWLLIAAILASVSWLQLMTIMLTKRSYTGGFVATAAIVTLISWLTFKFGLPFGLDNLPIFSPQLYASSTFLSSLGALLINTICILWLVVFVTRHTPYRTFFSGIRSALLKSAIAFVLSALLVLYLFAFVNIIRSLVTDSSISFELSHFYTINTYTILGLFTIGTITGVSCLIIYLFNAQLSVLVRNRWAKYFLIALIGSAFIFWHNALSVRFAFFLLSWLILFMGLLDIKRLKLVTDLFAPHMIFWAVFICAFCTAILQYFINVKERDSRKIYASQRMASERDDYMEYTFGKISDDILRDKLISNVA